jgi:hypothetical protein
MHVPLRFQLLSEVHLFLTSQSPVDPEVLEPLQNQRCGAFLGGGLKTNIA